MSRILNDKISMFMILSALLLTVISLFSAQNNNLAYSQGPCIEGFDFTNDTTGGKDYCIKKKFDPISESKEKSCDSANFRALFYFPGNDTVFCGSFPLVLGGLVDIHNYTGVKEPQIEPGEIGNRPPEEPLSKQPGTIPTILSAGPQQFHPLNSNLETSNGSSAISKNVLNFSNDKMGIEMNIPPRWALAPQTETWSKYVRFIADSYDFRPWFEIYVDAPLPLGPTALNEVAQYWSNDRLGTKTVLITNSSIAGFPAINFVKDFGDGFLESYYVTITDKDTYVLGYRFHSSEYFKYLPDVQEMLSSLKLS